MPDTPESAPTAPVVDSPPDPGAAASFASAALGDEPAAEPAAAPANEPAATPAAPAEPTQPEAQPAAEPAPADEPDAQPSVDAEEPAESTEPPTVDLKWGDEVGADPQPDAPTDEPLLPEAQAIVADLGEALDAGRQERATQLLLKTPRGRKMLGSFRIVRDVEERLGGEFTLEGFQELQAAKAEYDGIVSDLASNDPARLQVIAEDLLGSADQSHAWAPGLLDAVVERARANPALGARLRTTVVDSVVGEMLDAAAAATDEKSRRYLAQVANGVHKHLSGGANHPEYEQVFSGQGRQTAPGQPESDAESAEVRRLRAELADRDAATRRSAQSAVAGTLISDINSAVDQHLAHAVEALSIAEDRRGGVVFGGVQDRFRAAIENTVKADKTFEEVYTSRIGAAIAGDAQAQAHIQRAHRSAVTRAAQKAWPPIFAELRTTFKTTPAVADPQAELARRQEAGRPEPTGTGTPAVDVRQQPNGQAPRLADLRSEFRNLARQAIQN